MTNSTDSICVPRNLGIFAFLVSILGFLLSIGTYIVFFVCGKALALIPDMPTVRLIMLIISTAVLFAAFLLEGISSLKEAQPKWQMMVGITLWVLGAVFCTIMIAGNGS